MYLNCKTFFSFRYGTFSTTELVEAAVEHGITTLAITNINNTCNCWEFVQCCLQKGINPVVGTEIRNEDQLMYIVLAANNTGLKDINAFLTKHLVDKLPFPLRPDAELSAHCYIIYPAGVCEPGDLKHNERIGLLPGEVTSLYNIDMATHQQKFVVRQPVTIRNKQQHNLHRLLRAIDKNVLLSQLPAASVCNEEEIFLSPAVLLTAFSRYPSIITNTYRLLESCGITMDFRVDKTKKTFSASKEDDRVLLEKLADDGLKMRYGKKNLVAAERVARELKIIHDLGFTSYFLINWDIIRYAQSRGFYYVGRGSGANSIVAYCLRITDVDPIELNLYFERFLNPHRTSPPDFDIDFSYTDRDEVIDYIFKRYGKHHVALLASYPTFQYDAIVLQLGKVFGLPVEEIKALQLTQKPADHIQQLIIRYGRMMLNFPSHLSLHPCGMLISEAPIDNYAALFMPPKGFATAQIDMFVAEEIGLNKFDILSQRGLGHIREALSLIRVNKGIDIDIHDSNKFKNDERVASQVREANTIGCFYIESPAMRQLLKKLRCDDYITLVAASSIIRPGVSQSGMMREYIYRYHHPERTVYLHPLFEEHMKETFGVMVFQEDVIKIAHFFAGLDLGEA
ncbi:MAG: DNA polymerase III subunit alpha, partial [Chitinophagaceae bacterium]